MISNKLVRDPASISDQSILPVMIPCYADHNLHLESDSQYLLSFFLFYFILLFLHSGFVSRRMTIHMLRGEKRRTLLLFSNISTHSWTFRNLFADGYLEFLITAHVNARLLLDEIHPLPRISIWLNIDWWFYVKSY